MKPKILLVDDERSIRSSLHRIFRKNGFDVFEADGGAAALELLNNETVDVVVSDQRMPGMNGTEFLTQVKQQYPQIGRIMLSGQSDFDDLCDAINEANIYRFLPKPWSEEQLVEIVKEVVAQKESVSEIITSDAINIATVSTSKIKRNNKSMASLIEEASHRQQSS
ncbi:response regulator [Eionea flava]